MRYIIFLLLAMAGPASADTILIVGATVIDGTGAGPRGPVDIEVTDGRITRIGTGIRPRGANVVDARGKAVVPGLIDGHVHFLSVTGSTPRKDTPAQLQEEQRHGGKAFLAAGVTTVLDAAAPARLFLEPPKDAPRIVGLAPFLTPTGGYFSTPQDRGLVLADLWPPVKDPAEVKTRIAEAAPLKPLGVKVTIETGFGPFTSWPTFKEEMREAIRTEAEAAGLPVFVHSMSTKEHRLALTMKPYALVHSGFYEEEASPEIVSEIKASGAYVISTLSAWRLAHLMWERETLEDPWLQRLVSRRQLETAMDEEIRKAILKDVVVLNSPPWIPDFLARWASSVFFNEEIVRTSLTNGKAAIKRLYDAGIPIVMGSDSGNWPVWATYFHGVGAVLEIEMLIEAGLPPSEAIVASTSRAAKMLKVDQDLGTIEVGKRADLMILDADPLKDPKAFRKVAWVIKNGVMKSPSQWLE